MGRLDGKVAIITGAARGMGAATARLFAAEGAQVVIADVLDQEGDALAKKLGDRAFYFHLDVSDEAGWRTLVAETRQRFGGIEVLVNNAGILKFSTIIKFDSAVFERVIRVNLFGVFYGIKTVAPAMIEKKKGSIINICSAEALRGTNNMGAYGTSKWGVRGLTKIAAMELGHLGVRVNSLFPGPVNTPMVNPGFTEAELSEQFSQQPIQRVARPEEIARVSLFLASDESSYVCGAEITVDGGMTIGHYHGVRPRVVDSP